ncbi:MAG TPA: ATP-dependent zinc metalloprotease FtsH [Candidatus Paceibacterota bacterium]|nr:ATP-dependent zinc metalloprotease FtsH [Candidatus Paceibacterota bacterium]
MSNLTKNIIWAVITLIVISLIFSYFVQPAAAPTTLSLNQLVTDINAGTIKQIKVNGDELDITMTNGSAAVAQKEDESGITDTLKNLGVNQQALQNVDLEVVNQSGWEYWLGLLAPDLLTLLAIGFLFWLMFRQAKTGVNQAFQFGRSNLKLSNIKDKVMFKDVAGLKEAKEELIEVVDFLKNPQKFLDLGARIPRGILLMGPPGTGKTLVARAVAGESNVPFFYISASEFVEMFVGVGASRTRDAFMQAKRASPAILFIDEIDAVGRQRGAGMGGGSDEREQTLNQILVEMDGFDRDTRVIVLAATNRPDILDPALLRPGRFDRRVILDLPDMNDREAILKIHAEGKTLEKDVDLRRVAARTPGFSGADLANLMNEAAIASARHNKKMIGQPELLEAAEKVIMGPERKSRVISQKEKEITAYHEGGHALVAASVKDADPVQKVSIISRGFAGGYTMKLPNEDQHLKTRNQFLADLSMMMGGYVSEKLTFGDISTGASNDLKEASELARRMVVKYGMSDLGPIVFGKSEQMMFLGQEISNDKNYSERIASEIDEQIRKLLMHSHDIAEKILKSHKNALKKIADTLMEKEVLEQDDFNAVLKPFKIKPIAA